MPKSPKSQARRSFPSIFSPASAVMPSASAAPGSRPLRSARSARSAGPCSPITSREHTRGRTQGRGPEEGTLSRSAGTGAPTLKDPYKARAPHPSRRSIPFAVDHQPAQLDAAPRRKVPCRDRRRRSAVPSAGPPDTPPAGSAARRRRASRRHRHPHRPVPGVRAGPARRRRVSDRRTSGATQDRTGTARVAERRHAMISR